MFAPDARRLRDLYPRLGPWYAGIVAGAMLERWFTGAPQEVDDIGAGFRQDVVTRMNLGLGDTVRWWARRCRPAWSKGRLV